MPARRRRCLYLIVLTLAVSLAARALAPAQEPPMDAPAPAAGAPGGVPEYGPPTQSTQVFGEVPVDLRGIWVIVSHGGLPQSRVRNTVEIYSIEGQGEATKLEYHVVKLPADWQKGLDEANLAFKAWTPTEAQLAALARSVDSLEVADPNRFVWHRAKLAAPAEYAAAEVEPGAAMALEGSALALRIQHAYRPGPAKEGQAQLMSDEALFVVQKVEPARLEGDHSRIVLAAGFLPVPVVTQGPFTMYRLRAPGEKPPPSSALARIWDALTRGCK